MSKEDLPSIGDFAENNSNLPSIDDFLKHDNSEDLPSVEEFIVKEEVEYIQEETQTIEDLDNEA